MMLSLDINNTSGTHRTTMVMEKLRSADLEAGEAQGLLNKDGSQQVSNTSSFTFPRWLKFFLAVTVGVLVLATTVAVSVHGASGGKGDSGGQRSIAALGARGHAVKAAEKDSTAYMSSMETAKHALSRAPLIDGHNDLAWVIRSRRQNHVDEIDLSRNVIPQWGPSHTDIPRQRQGMQGAQFWSLYVSCSSQYHDAVRVSLDQLDTIKRFVASYPDTFTFVTSAKGLQTYEGAKEKRESVRSKLTQLKVTLLACITEAFTAGKIASLIGMEGGHSIDSSLAALRMFYDLGVRYMTLTHTCNTPWADSSTQDDQPDRPGSSGGLSQFGKTVVREMNRVGMMVDLAHVSHATMSDTLNVSTAPVIFSHSSAWAICHNNRNVRDDILKRIPENGGIVMVNFWTEFVNCEPNYQTVSTVSQVADHVEHIVTIAGHDHVGIGSDFDGIGFDQVPEGLEDSSQFPNLFAELARRGWTSENLEKLAGNNLIRVFTQVEKEAVRLAGLEQPFDDHIPSDQVNDLPCRPDF